MQGTVAVQTLLRAHFVYLCTSALQQYLVHVGGAGWACVCAWWAGVTESLIFLPLSYFFVLGKSIKSLFSLCFLLHFHCHNANPILGISWYILWFCVSGIYYVYILCYMLLSCHYLKRTKSSPFKKKHCLAGKQWGSGMFNFRKRISETQRIKQWDHGWEAVGLVKCFKKWNIKLLGINCQNISSGLYVLTEKG